MEAIQKEEEETSGIEMIRLKQVTVGLCLLLPWSEIPAQQRDRFAAPRILPDIIVELSTKKKLVGRVHDLDDKQLVFAEVGRNRKLYSLQTVRVERWDGFTNASEILEVVKARLEQVETELKEIEISGIKSELNRRKLREFLSQSLTISDRIRKDATKEFAEKELLRSKYSGSPVGDAEKRFEVYDKCRLALTPLLQGLQREAFDSLPDIASSVAMEIGKTADALGARISERIRAQVTEQFRSQLGPLLAIAETLSPIPKQNDYKVIEKLDEMKATLSSQRGNAAKAAPLNLLGEDVRQWFVNREDRIQQELRKIEVCLARTSEIRQVRSELNKMDAAAKDGNKPEMGNLAAVYNRLETMLDKAQARLSKEPDDWITLMATEHLKVTKRKIAIKRRLVGLTEASYQATRLREQVESSQSTEQLRALLEEVETNKQAMQRLDRTEFDGSQRVLFSKSMDSLTNTHWACQTKLEQVQFVRMSQSLQNLLQPNDSSYLAAKAPAIKQMTDNLRMLKTRIADLNESVRTLALKASLQALDKRIDRDLTLSSDLVTLFDAHAELAEVPEAIGSREQFNAGRLRVDAASKKLAGLSKVPDVRLSNLKQYTDAQLANARRLLAMTGPRIQFEELDSAIRTQLDSGSKAVQDRDLAASTQACQSAATHLDDLESLVGKAAELSEDTELKQRLAQQQQRRQLLDQQVKELVQKMRTEVGWIALPSGEEQVLIAPNPFNELMLINLLVGQKKFDEAAKALSDFKARYRDPASVQRAREVGTEIEFARAAERESADDHAAALSKYQQIIAQAKGSDWEIASKAAATRIRQKLANDAATERATLNLLCLAAIGVIGVGFVAVLRWRDTEPGRLKRAEAYIKLAEAAIANSDQNAKDASLRRAAELLSGVSEGNVQANRLRERLSEPKTVEPEVQRTEQTGIRTPELSDSLAEILNAKSPEIADAQVCLQFLATAEDLDEELKEDLVRCLKRVLSPREAHIPDELILITRLSRTAQQLLPQVDDFKLFELTALWRLGREAEALKACRKIRDLKQVQGQNPKHRLVYGICLVHLDQPQEAMSVLRPLRNNETVGDEAKRWSRIAGTAAFAMGKFHSKQRAADIVSSVLTR